MIVTELITINDVQYKRTYSDINMMIERDGEQFAEAVDWPHEDFIYTETDIPITQE